MSAGEIIGMELRAVQLGYLHKNAFSQCVPYDPKVSLHSLARYAFRMIPYILFPSVFDQLLICHRMSESQSSSSGGIYFQICPCPRIWLTVDQPRSK